MKTDTNEWSYAKILAFAIIVALVITIVSFTIADCTSEIATYTSVVSTVNNDNIILENGTIIWTYSAPNFDWKIGKKHEIIIRHYAAFNKYNPFVAYDKIISVKIINNS